MEANGIEGMHSLGLLQARAALARTPSFPSAGAGGAGTGTDAAVDRKRWQASLDFESMFLGQMYKSMRKTVGHSELTEPSFAREVFLEMFDREVASSNARSPHTSGPQGLRDAAEGRSQSLAAKIYRALAMRPPAVEAGGAAGPKAPPLDEAALRPLVDEAASRYGLPANLLRGVIHAESGGRPDALSPKGAKGLMQLMDTTAADMGVKNSWDPRENILGGARYLRAMLDRFGWNERLALAGYNAGPGAVEKHGGIPPYPETRDYVERVLRRREALDAREGPR